MTQRRNFTGKMNFCDDNTEGPVNEVCAKSCVLRAFAVAGPPRALLANVRFEAGTCPRW